MDDQRLGLFEIGDVELTLRRIVVGYRALTVAWVFLLVVVSLAGDSLIPRRGVLWSLIGLLAVWLAVLIWANTRRPELIRSWWFLALDLGLAVVVLYADWLAGAVSLSLTGGYPLSAVAVAIYARGGIAGLGTAGVLLLAAVVRRVGFVQDATAARLISEVASWVFPAVLLGWAAGVIRSSDRRRRESEEALADERAKRVRVEERAELAAHLHDSVLQTLALIQRSSGDAAQVTSLARRQERELRAWLYGVEHLPAGDSLMAGLRAVCDEIEGRHRVKVELVSVGDVELGEHLSPLLRASGEAISNAVRHAGVDTVDVYSEVVGTEVVVFVRDRGTGFDPNGVPADRAGLRDSIVGRMERAGGSALIRSTPGRGTEVEMRIRTEETVS